MLRGRRTDALCERTSVERSIASRNSVDSSMKLGIQRVGGGIGRLPMLLEFGNHGLLQPACWSVTMRSRASPPGLGFHQAPLHHLRDSLANGEKYVIPALREIARIEAGPDTINARTTGVYRGR